jgi:2-oxoglutarate ferredoxin oxidoreductase subunit gamma
MSRTSMVFAGSGGQGVITASIILGEAACLYEGLHAVQTQVYGPEARGGSTRADLVISTEPIRFPKVISPHVLICLTQEAYNKFGSIIRPGGLLVVDPSFVTTSKNTDARQAALPMYETIKREIGKPVVFNICMLGCVTAITDAVHPESVMKALKNHIPANYLEMNMKAFKLGLELGETWQNGRLGVPGKEEKGTRLTSKEQRSIPQ